MKGRAKIELIDAKSGEVVQTVESDNLVTNAINNVYNLPTSALGFGSSDGVLNGSNNYWAGMFGTSLADKMLCGMLCFSEDVLADVNHCIPSNEEMDNIVAYASKRGNVDSSNLMRGSFDSVNSAIGSNYASLVFNWGTSEGNGVIKSVCLTSMMGGEQAYHGSQMELKKTLCNLYYNSFASMGSLSSSEPIPSQQILSGMPLCSIPAEYATSNSAGYVTQSGKLVLLNYANLTDVKAEVWKFLNGSQRLGISTNLDRVLTVSNHEQEKHFDITSFLASGTKRPCASDYSSVYLDITYTAPNTTIRGVEFSGDDVTLSNFVVVLSNIRVATGQYDDYVKLGNYLFVIDYTSNTTVYRVDILTGAVDTIIVPRQVSSLGVFLGQLLIVSFVNTEAEQYMCYRVSNVDLSLHILSVNATINPYVVSRIDALPEPFVVTYKAGVEPHLAFITAYLATVNNLNTQVTKTSAQAMRITYTLTDT